MSLKTPCCLTDIITYLISKVRRRTVYKTAIPNKSENCAVKYAESQNVPLPKIQIVHGHFWFRWNSFSFQVVSFWFQNYLFLLYTQYCNFKCLKLLWMEPKHFCTTMVLNKYVKHFESKGNAVCRRCHKASVFKFVR